MSGKIHALMIFVGVLMMTAAGGVFVRYGLDGPDPNLPQAGPDAATTVVDDDASPTEVTPSSTTTPSPTPTPRPTPSPTPKATRTPTPTPKPSTAAPAAWRLVWSDEFNGSALDPAKWAAADSSVVDLACMTSRAANLTVGDGVLNLTAQREDYTCGAQATSYTAALLDTSATASFTHGAFEISARSPNGAGDSAGLWPVFWLHGAGGEIEVVAAPGGAANYRGVTHGIVDGGSGAGQQSTYTFPSGYPGDGFHTYRVEWELGVIRWYVDGLEVYRRDRTTTSWLDSAFGQACDLRLGLRVGGAPGDPDATTTFPATLQVGYVRVYQR